MGRVAIDRALAATLNRRSQEPMAGRLPAQQPRSIEVIAVRLEADHGVGRLSGHRAVLPRGGKRTNVGIGNVQNIRKILQSYLFCSSLPLMPRQPATHPPQNTVSVRIGRWVEARASGW